ncbi:uncharacterized protein LOC112350242 [Selaginella moellendorffii]|uniref:uncharacterized protein LOC112350242 n=1 Tax=Selaginella moellendorffii TaxID=88036 RepID=UPI000D1CB2F9|nr:uncharacterized protein LOC112350242 [Selaginella moellendorffii]|eukprot:XP_024541852.1 uncharacterized protein LOC112350242 [Selaginella moellendorffii]
MEDSRGISMTKEGYIHNMNTREFKAKSALSPGRPPSPHPRTHEVPVTQQRHSEAANARSRVLEELGDHPNSIGEIWSRSQHQINKTSHSLTIWHRGHVLSFFLRDRGHVTAEFVIDLKRCSILKRSKISLDNELVSNSRWRVFAPRMQSSTYTATRRKSSPHLYSYTFPSTARGTHPRLLKNASMRSNQTRGDCLSPYRARFSLQTRCSSPGKQCERPTGAVPGRTWQPVQGSLAQRSTSQLVSTSPCIPNLESG